MNQTEWSDPTGAARASSEDKARQGLQEEKRAAERLADEARAAASSAGTKAKDAAADKAEELQGMAANHLRSFADAVRVAGDELAEKDPGPISDIVRQAAQGLEQFSGSFERKSPAEIIDGFRDFGRQNPVGFLAGAMLAGFSLARFAGSATPSGTGQAVTSPSAQTGYGAAPRAGETRPFAGSAPASGAERAGAYGQQSTDTGATAPANRETAEVPS